MYNSCQTCMYALADVFICMNELCVYLCAYTYVSLRTPHVFICIYMYVQVCAQIQHNVITFRYILYTHYLQTLSYMITTGNTNIWYMIVCVHMYRCTKQQSIRCVYVYVYIQCVYVYVYTQHSHCSIQTHTRYILIVNVKCFSTCG